MTEKKYVNFYWKKRSNNNKKVKKKNEKYSNIQLFTLNFYLKDQFSFILGKYRMFFLFLICSLQISTNNSKEKREIEYSSFE